VPTARERVSENSRLIEPPAKGERHVGGRRGYVVISKSRNPDGTASNFEDNGIGGAGVWNDQLGG